MSHGFGSFGPAATGDKLDEVDVDPDTKKEYSSIATRLIAATSIHQVCLLLPAVAYPIITLRLVKEDVSEAAAVTGWVFMVNAGVLLLGSLVVGMLADKFSRKAVIVATCMINVIFYFLQSTFTVFSLALPFYLSRAFIPYGLELRVVRAYIADVSVTEVERISRFSRLDAVFGIAIAIGPTVGGLLCLFDLVTPITLSTVILAAVCVFYLFGLPRTDREKDLRKPGGSKHVEEISSFGDLAGLFRFLIRDKLSLAAVVLYFLGTIGSQDVMDILLFYVQYRLGWQSGWQLGLVALCTGVSTLLFQAFAAPWLLRKFSHRKIILMVICCLVTALGHLLVAMSRDAAMLLSSLPLAAVFRLVNSYFVSLIAQRVPTRYTGAAMGLIGATEPIAQLVGAPIVTGLLEEFTHPNKNYHWILPGSPFLFGGSAYVLQAFFIATVFRVLLNRAESDPAPTESPEETSLVAEKKPSDSPPSNVVL